MNLLTTQLDTLQNNGLVQLVKGQPDLEYLFRHALIQDAAYHSMLRSQREGVHRQIGMTLETLFADRLDEVVGVIGHHYLLAGERGQAARYFTRAGDAAAAVYANEEAIHYYQQALEIALDFPETADLLPHLCQVLGRVWEISNAYDHALQLYEQMADHGQQTDDLPLHLAGLLGQTKLRTVATPAYAATLGFELAARAMELAKKLGDEKAQITVLWNLLNSKMLSGSMREAIAHGQEALTLARRRDFPEQRAYILNDMAFTYSIAGPLTAALAAYEEVHELWRSLGNLPMLADSLGGAAIANYYSGRFQQSIVYSDEALQIGEQIDNLQVQSYCRVMVGPAYWQLGQPGQALLTSADCIARGEKAAFVAGLLYAHAFRSFIHFELGDGERALADAQTAVALGEKFPPAANYAFNALARAHLLQKNWTAAQEIITQIKTGPRYGESATVQNMTCEVETELACQRQDWATAQTAVTELHQAIEKMAYNLLRPKVHYLSGKIALAQGDSVAGRQHLEKALQLARTQQSVPVQVPILTALSQLEGGEDRAQAAVYRQEAIAIQQQLDADLATYA